MALIDLDKIIIKRTIQGIRCTACGGNLVVSKRKSIVGRLASMISFGAVKPESYACETCKDISATLSNEKAKTLLYYINH